MPGKHREHDYRVEQAPVPLKAIRLKCLDCSCGSVKEVRLCPVFDCPLWKYRFGVRPSTAQKRGHWVGGKSPYADKSTQESAADGWPENPHASTVLT